MLKAGASLLHRFLETIIVNINFQLRKKMMSNNRNIKIKELLIFIQI